MDSAPRRSFAPRWLTLILALTLLLAASWPAALTMAAPPRAEAVTFQVTYDAAMPQQARDAFADSVKVWEPLLNSTVPIKVNVTWKALGECSNGCTLAAAGATSNPVNFKNAPLPNVEYPVALANSLAEERLNGDAMDIDAEYNSQVNWFYGDGAPAAGQNGFKSTTVHELAHGLGFNGNLSYDAGAKTGSYGNPTAIFDQFVVNGGGQKLITYTNGSTELGSQMTGNSLFFNGPKAVAANGGAPVKLYAPDPFKVGSSIHHLDQQTYKGTPNALMIPEEEGQSAIIAPGPVTEAIFKDLGWPGATATPFAVTLKTSGAAGAISQGGSTDNKVFSYTANPTANTVFLGWKLDDQPKGYAPTITLTVDKAYTLEAVFAPRQVFADGGPDKTGATEAIAQLSARGVIKGCDQAANLFCPTEPTLRAQMAVLIVRAMDWSGEPSSNPFTDRNGVDDELWNAVGILANKGVVNGYGDGTFGTTSPVLNAQVISFITRAMVKKGLWTFQADNGTIYPNVPASSGHRQDLVTYAFYAGTVRGTTGTTANFDGWDATSSRAYFAFVLWQALESYYAADKVGFGGYIP